MRSIILLLLAVTLAFTPNVSYAQEEPEIFP